MRQNILIPGEPSHFPQQGSGDPQPKRLCLSLFQPPGDAPSPQVLGGTEKQLRGPRGRGGDDYSHRSSTHMRSGQGMDGGRPPTQPLLPEEKPAAQPGASFSCSRLRSLTAISCPHLRSPPFLRPDAFIM